MTISNYWQQEYIPEIAHTAVPVDLQRQAYADWQKKQDKTAMRTLIRTFGKLINSEVGRYQGTLNRPVLTSFAKKYVADAVRSFRPETGNQLSTHIVNQLQRLHRLNYRNVQGLRSSEDAQAKMNTFFQVRTDLANELGRDPSSMEIANRMNVPIKLVGKLNQQIKLERGPDETQTTALIPENFEEKEVVDFIYYELPDTHKKIMEYKVGYNNSPILSNKEIAKRLKISPVRVTQISKAISKKFRDQIQTRLRY